MKLLAYSTNIDKKYRAAPVSFLAGMRRDAETYGSTRPDHLEKEC
jgi:hypothetical protein